MSSEPFESNGPGRARVIEVPERLPDPRHRLDPRAKPMWRVGAAIGATVLLLFIALVAFGAYQLFEFDRLWLWLVGGLWLSFFILDVWLAPSLRYRYWRYEIRTDEADLKHGWFTQTRQLVPMARIQHVDTRRGPLERRFGLASVVLYTAAGPASIPALSPEVAADVRDRIATLANVHDDL